MLRNIRDMAISKQLLISLVFITLMFTAFSIDVNGVYASDLNESSDELGVELDVEDKLENSQDTEILQAKELTYDDIRQKIKNANAGDTIYLEGKYVAKSENDFINVTKKLTITSKSTATLDGKNKSLAFIIKSGGAGTVISNLKFINGYSVDEGGAIRVLAKSVTVDNCEFENNFAESSSGAIHTSYTPRVAENMVLSNSKFKNNSASAAAGAVGLFGYNFKIENCVFDSNHVERDKNSYGGAIQVGLNNNLSKGIVKNCNFTNNKAVSYNGTSHGGAGCLRNGTSYENCIFTGNTADHGGAVTFHASGSLKDCKFYDNVANYYGGALSIDLDHKTMILTLDDCKFDGNSAPLGGAAKLDGMNVIIKNSDFTNNTATEYGGAVNIDATDVNIMYSNFKDNVANINGGAVFITGSNTEITKSNFIGNDALPDVNKRDDGLGGAVYVNSTKAVIENNVFNYNTARNGSAVYYDKSGKELKLTNNVMYENQAWVYLLPVYAHDIFYGETENIGSVIYGGNNIAKYNDLDVSNAVYNAAVNSALNLNGENPVLGATRNGQLYQDAREYNMDVLMTVTHEDGSVVYNKTLKSSYLGEVSDELNNLKPGTYQVKSTHFEDTYYKAITNTTYFRVIPKIDNKILKSAKSSDEFNIDDYVLWTLIITNNGPNDATEVVVRDLLPEGVEYVNDTSGGSYDKSTGKLTIGNLSVGQTITVEILTKITKTGEITNVANVTAHEYDTNMTNNKDNASINVNPSCDLSVVKSVNNSNPNYNDLVDWTIVVKNNGPDIAHSVNVMDVLPESLVYVDSTGGYDIENEHWFFNELKVNQEVVVHIVTRVNATGLIENDVLVFGREHDRNMSNNYANASINVKKAVDLGIVKSVNVSVADFGDLVKWSLTVLNNGPDNATGVYVVDVLPDGFEYVDCVLPRGSYSDGVISIGHLAVGETFAFDIISRVSATGAFVNVANVTGNEYDYDLSNNDANKSIFINPASDLEIIKNVNETNPKYAESITWIIIVKNNGPDNAHNVTVIEKLPGSVIWQNDDSNGKYDKKSGVWNIGDLDNGKAVTLKIICKVNATGNTTNEVNVGGKEYDYNKTNNHDNSTIEVEPAADLAIVKEVNDTKPKYLSLVKWTLTITNNGPDKANGVYVDEILPEGLILVNYTASKGIYDSGMWGMCCLEKGEVQTLEIICKVNKTGKITNAVEIHGDEYDPNPSNNVADKTVDVPPAVDLELIKEVNNTRPYYGETVMWTILIRNNGPDNATGVVVEDILSSRVEFVGYSASRGVYSGNNWNVGALNVGGVEYLNITCIVKALGEVSNYAEVNSTEFDWNESNNYDVATMETSPIVDLAIEKLVNNSKPNYGDLVKWTLVVTNNGPNDASDVRVVDALPEGLTLIGLSSDDYDGEIWHIGYLDAGHSVKLEIISKVSATGEFINFADVYSEEADSDLSNNHANSTIDVPPASDISITKIASKYYYAMGEIIKYSIEVTNNGPDRAENVVVDEIMDKTLKLKSFSVSAGDFDKLSKTWSIDSLDNGDSATLDIEAVALGEGVLNNTVKASSDNYDPDLNNNEDFAEVNVSENHDDVPDVPVKSPNPKNNVVKRENNELAKAVLERNVSGNSFFVLLISLIFSMVFLGDGISKRR